MSTERQDVIDDCIEALQEALQGLTRCNEAIGLVYAMHVLETLKSTENGGAT